MIYLFTAFKSGHGSADNVRSRIIVHGILSKVIVPIHSKESIMAKTCKDWREVIYDNISRSQSVGIGRLWEKDAGNLQ